MLRQARGSRNSRRPKKKAAAPTPAPISSSIRPSPARSERQSDNASPKIVSTVQASSRNTIRPNTAASPLPRLHRRSSARSSSVSGACSIRRVSPMRQYVAKGTSTVNALPPAAGRNV